MLMSPSPISDICCYKKVTPFNGGTPLIQPSTSDFYFSWNQVPNAVGEAILPFTAKYRENCGFEVFVGHFSHLEPLFGDLSLLLLFGPHLKPEVMMMLLLGTVNLRL